MLRRPVLAVVVAVVVVLLGGACGGDDDGTVPTGSDRAVTSEAGTTATTGAAGTGGPGDEVAWPGDGGDVSAAGLGAGLAVDLPAGWDVTPLAATGPAGGGGCERQQGALDAGDVHVQIEVNAASCAGTGDRPLNGQHGTYVGLDDVAEPLDAERTDVAAGTLVTFAQTYTECTNECTDHRDTLAILTFAAPPDPDRPSVVLLSPKGDVPVERLAALAAAVHPA